MGDDEEHAILLISYFLQLGVPLCRIVFGEGIGMGSTSWVLTQTSLSSGLYLWNPMNGKSYLTSDPLCPLTVITCMADTDNIYYNTQQE
jgi:hypothetical protein